MELSQSVKVWDPLIRLFHWSLVISFLIAYISAEEFMPVHTWAGYIIAGLIFIRVIWGFVGTEFAQFRSFIYRPTKILAYIKDITLHRARRYLGHNPAGGAMVLTLILSLSLTVISGLFFYGIEEFGGPLASIVHNWPIWLGDAFEEVHEFSANLTVFLIALHLIGVLLSSIQHKENLVKAMINGRKEVLGQ